MIDPRSGFTDAAVSNVGECRTSGGVFKNGVLHAIFDLERTSVDKNRGRDGECRRGEHQDTRNPKHGELNRPSMRDICDIK